MLEFIPNLPIRKTDLLDKMLAWGVPNEPDLLPIVGEDTDV